MHHQQQAIATTQNEAVLEVPYDIAWEEGAKLANCVRTDKDGVTVLTGVHPERGNIHIIIPTLGEGLLLLPFVVQQF
jgi:hypothetical protein